MINQGFIGALNGFSSGRRETETNLTELLTLINKRQLVTGKAENFNARINALNSEINALKSKYQGAQKKVVSDYSGYFVSAADGYEGLIKTTDVDTLTPEVLRGLAPGGERDGAVKVITDYQWYIAMVTDGSRASLLTEGTEVRLKIPEAFETEMPAEIYKINKPGGTGDAVVILKCSQMSEKLASIRTPEVQILLKKYTGLRVSTTAVRKVDGKTGVFLRIGTKVKFCKVKIIYSASGYSVCEQSDYNKKDVLHLYDEVITEGKDLVEKYYDGKDPN